MKINQDQYIINLNVLENMHLFAVCDGHGINGRQSSLLVKMKFADYVQEYIQQGKETAQKI